MDRLIEEAAEGRLVAFVGAGVSVLPPSCLPSWWEVNRAVLDGLAGEAGRLLGDRTASEMAALVARRQETGKLPPEYQAELLADRLGERYFPVLQCLDGRAPNAVHLGLAALAAAGRLRAIVTTNFDRNLEAAFDAVGAPLEVTAGRPAFDRLADEPDRLAAGPCHLLKIHGSAEAPETLVDTLAQRKVGLGAGAATCLRRLLADGHWLFLGYSGADLEAEPNYLFLRGEIERARGFTWLVRTGTQPLPSVAGLAFQYGDRARVVEGELPAWFDPLVAGLDVPAPEAADLEARRAGGRALVGGHVGQWAADRGPIGAGLLLSHLVDAAGHRPEKVRLLEAILERIPEADRGTRDHGLIAHALGSVLEEQGHRGRALALLEEARAILAEAPPDRRLERVSAERTLGVLGLEIGDVHLGLGRLDEAGRCFEEARVLLDEHGSAADRQICRVRQASILFQRGRYEEARRIHAEGLEMARAAGDEIDRGSALNHLASIELMTDRPAEAIPLLEEYLAICDRLGDESRRASALHNLGNAHYLIGDLERAGSCWRTGLAIHEALGEEADRQQTLSSLALIHCKRDEWSEAIALYEQALAFAAAADDIDDQARTHGNLANALRDSGRDEPAREHYRKALAFFDAMASPAAKAPWLVEQAVLDYHRGRPAEAVGALEEALSIQESAGDDAADHTRRLLAMARKKAAGGLAARIRSWFGG